MLKLIFALHKLCKWLETEKELRVLREYIEQALNKEWNHYFTSPAGALILFVQNRHLLPLINEMLMQLTEVR